MVLRVGKEESEMRIWCLLLARSSSSFCIGPVLDILSAIVGGDASSTMGGKTNK